MARILYLYCAVAARSVVESQYYYQMLGGLHWTPLSGQQSTFTPAESSRVHRTHHVTICDIWTPDESDGIRQIVWGSIKYCHFQTLHHFVTPSHVTSSHRHSVVIILHCQFPSLPSFVISDLFHPY